MSQTLHLLDDRITIDPDICNGHPTVRGKRITVQSILEYLSAGDSEADILAEFPGLEPEDIRACLTFASRLMDQRYELLKVA
ncbi:MAG: DUF433 domain-containing protein [Betaproteobacteria bacterium]|nr:DUF433 domain-containing protein [Betaproteobacteria bacterium]